MAALGKDSIVVRVLKGVGVALFYVGAALLLISLVGAMIITVFVHVIIPLYTWCWLFLHK
jgi:hypothetical protein